MLFKTLTCILALLVVAEGGYIFLHRHPINRFKSVDEDGYVAFDSATGQLCRTFRPGPPHKEAQPAPIKPAPSSFQSKKFIERLKSEICWVPDREMDGKLRDG